MAQPRPAPFRFGQVVDGPYFTDREAEARALAEDIQHGVNVVLISPRRFGKTSLVLHVIDEVRRAGVLVAYLDLQRTPTKERLADHLASAIYSGLVSSITDIAGHTTALAHSGTNLTSITAPVPATGVSAPVTS